MDLMLFVDLWEYLSVERHVPGKLSLKVDLAIRNHPKASAISGDVVSQWPAIRKVRLNVFSRTLKVEYDIAKLPYERLESLFACSDPQTMRLLAEQFSRAV